MTINVIEAKCCAVFHLFLAFRAALYKDKESLSEESSCGDGNLGDCCDHVCINEAN